jgi:hypothetical protein
MFTQRAHNKNVVDVITFDDARRIGQPVSTVLDVHLIEDVSDASDFGEAPVEGNDNFIEATVRVAPRLPAELLT